MLLKVFSGIPSSPTAKLVSETNYYTDSDYALPTAHSVQYGVFFLLEEFWLCKFGSWCGYGVLDNPSPADASHPDKSSHLSNNPWVCFSHTDSESWTDT